MLQIDSYAYLFPALDGYVYTFPLVDACFYIFPEVDPGPYGTTTEGLKLETHHLGVPSRVHECHILSITNVMTRVNSDKVLRLTHSSFPL